MRLRLRGAAMAAHKQAALKRQQRSWLSMRRRLRGAAMAAHKWCGGEAAAAGLAADMAARERRSDGRAQVVRRRSGSSGAGC